MIFQINTNIRVMTPLSSHWFVHAFLENKKYEPEINLLSNDTPIKYLLIVRRCWAWGYKGRNHIELCLSRKEEGEEEEKDAVTKEGR